MFEDALLESKGRLKTQSKYWMAGTLLLNAGVLALMILIPLLHPETLPKSAIIPILIAPAPPLHVVQVETHAAAALQQTRVTTIFTAPPSIPRYIDESHNDAPPQSVGTSVSMTPGPGNGTTAGDPFGDILGKDTPVVVTKPKPPGRINVSRGVAAGNLIVQTQILYPAIAKAAGIHGAVVLHAIISKSGTIENLAVESGPAMLRQAALDGVRSWRYRPFLLNGDPTEVDTVITVNFTNGSDGG